MEIKDDGAADPRGRDGQDPPAHLPRGQLLRRPQAGHAAARRSWTRGDTIKITQTATPVQLDQVLTSLQSDSREDLKDLLDRLNVALNSKPTAAEDRSSRPVGARPDRGASRSTTPTTTSRRPRRSTAEVLEALLGTEPEPRRRAADPRHRAHRRRARSATRTQLQGPDHELQHDDGGVRVASRATCARRSASWRRRWRTPTARSRRSTPRSRPRARSRARSCPGVRETPATIDAAFPWIAQTRPLWARTELGGLAERALAGQRRPRAR